MDAIFQSNVLFQFLAGIAAVIGLLMQFKWSDKRTIVFKKLRNLLMVISAGLILVGVWVTLEDNSEKADAKRSLEDKYDSLQLNFDSVKIALRQSTYVIDKLNSQLIPFINTALRRYPKLDSASALARLKSDFSVGRDIVFSNNQSGGVTTHTNRGIINQGGFGNTYNQQINPEIPQRSFSITDREWFEKNLPIKSKAFAISVYYNDSESIKYANEIADYFKAKGLVMMISPVGQIHGDYPKDKIGKSEVSLSNDSTWFSITIYPLY